jgi:hypothetical protein
MQPRNDNGFSHGLFAHAANMRLAPKETRTNFAAL